jgi:hypothetical protein
VEATGLATSLLESPPENPEVNITMVLEENTEKSDANKKRGRKPKGGKLIVKQTEKSDDAVNPVNVILHLKCSMTDFKTYDKELTKMVTDPMIYNPIAPPNIMSYFPDDPNRRFSYYSYNERVGEPTENSQEEQQIPANLAYNIDSQEQLRQFTAAPAYCQKCTDKINDKDEDVGVPMKEINTKLKSLKIHLYKNQLHDKKSACFWCTYEFDNPPCYIPKYEIDDEIHGYGSFCRPECAVAYLMKENLDDSTKFEQYHLLNQIYSRVYNYAKNIKPAPDPHYLLDKFYGSLTIQEYRKLLKSDHMLLVVDKPMTRILPELHDDNDNFVLNIFGGKPTTTTGQTGMYKVKRESEKQKGPSKSSIMRDKFGLA